MKTILIIEKIRLTRDFENQKVQSKIDILNYTTCAICTSLQGHHGTGVDHHQKTGGRGGRGRGHGDSLVVTLSLAISAQSRRHRRVDSAAAPSGAPRVRAQTRRATRGRGIPAAG